MTLFSPPIPRDYRVTIEFRSGGECFAAETYAVRAIGAFDAERLGRARAALSAFCNEQVPELDLLAHVADDPPPEPDGDPTPSSPGRLEAACPRCLSTDIVRDACVRWHEMEQRWVLASVHDFDTCQRCGAGGDALAIWLALPVDADVPGVSGAPPDPADYRAAVRGLSGAMGQAFRLHRIDGLSYPEIARTLGISSRKVEKLIGEALAHIIRSLDGAHREQPEA